MKEVKLNTQYCPTCREHYTTQAVCPMCGKSPPKEAKSCKKASSDNIPYTLVPTEFYIGENRKTKKWALRGKLFDSKTEAWRYDCLFDLQSHGVIRHLHVQPTAIVRKAYYLSGRWYTRTKAGKPRKVSQEVYTPDFVYIRQGVMVIEEVKGLQSKKKKGVKVYKPYSKGASNLKQYILQARYAHRDDVLFMIAAGKSDNSMWRYFQQSHGYPELSINYDLEMVA